MNQETKLQFKLVNGIVLVPIKINDINGHMAWDTGASRTVFNTQYIQGNGEDKETVNFSDTLTSSPIKIGTFKELKIANLTFNDIEAVYLDMDYVEKPLRKYDPDLVFLGSIGIDLMQKKRILIDYNTQEIIINPASDETFDYELPVKITKAPVFEFTTQDLTLPCILDTGANSFLMDKEYQTRKEIRIIDNSFMFDYFVFAKEAYHNTQVLFDDFHDLFEKTGGKAIIGFDVLNHRRCLFDFINNKVLLSKPRHKD